MTRWLINNGLMAGIALSLLFELAGGAWAAEYVWDFDVDEGVAGWTLSGLRNEATADGLLKMTATRGNPMLFTPRVEINAAEQKAVRFRMRLGKGIASKGCFLFITDAQPKYTDAAQVLFDCASDGAFHDYEVDMSAHPLWQGNVLQLRFQPFYVQWPMPDAQRTVEVDRFEVPGTAELLPNGGFEEIGDRDYPAGWTKFCETPLPIDAGDLRKSGNPANSLVSDVAFGGKRAIHVSIPDGQKEIGGWQTRVAIKPRKLYRLSFRAKRVGNPHAVASINEFGADGRRTVHHECAVTSTQWQTYTKDLESSDKTVGLQIAAIIWSSTGQAWFDDFSLQKIDLSTQDGAGKIDASPFNLLTRDVATPHIPWAVPHALGPVNVLAIPKHREIVELSQRLSLDYATWTKFEPADAGAGGHAGLNDLYYGRHPRGLTASYGELKAKLGNNYDCVLIGPQRWGRTFDWQGLPESLKETVLGMVRQGAGLVYVRPLAKTRRDLESRTDQQMAIPASLVAGVPFEGLTVLDQDMKDQDWLQCFSLGAGRVAIVDYQSESFGHWEGERSFRRGMASPFTPDVTYDYRAKPLFYEYYQSLLAKLVLWAANREGPVSLAAARFDDGHLRAEIRNDGDDREVDAEIVVRDADNNEEFVCARRLPLEAGEVQFSQLVSGLKSGGHFADLWLKQDGKTLTWGSTYFQTVSHINITNITTDKPSYEKGDTVQGRLVLDGKLPASVMARIDLTDSLGRVLRRDQITVADTNEIPFQVSLAGEEAILHTLQATLVQEDVVVCAKTVDIIIRKEPAPDDFKFYFWTPSANNSMPSRYMLNDFYRKGFDVAFIGYLYAQGPEQFRPLLLNTVRANLDVALFAFSLAGWDAGSDPTATVSLRCLTRPEYRDGMFKVLKQHASVAEHFPVYGYGLGDEAGICGHGQDFCFSPTCLEYTRGYLQSRYGSLHALNREWGTEFASWDEVSPMTKPDARAHGNIAPWVDHRLAMEDMFAGLVKESADVIRTQDAGARVGAEGITGGGMYGSNGESSTVGYDFGKIIPAGKFWIAYFQHYPQIEFLRSFASPDSVLGTYATPFEEAPGGYFEDAWQNEQTARFVPWFGLFNGMNATMYWGAMQTEWHGFYSPDFKPTPWSRHITETIAEIKSGIGKLILNCRRDNTGIAIHYSPESFHVQTIQGGRERVESPKAFCRILEAIGLQYDFVSRQQMAQDKLSQYKVLILPYSYAISAEEAEQIRAFVANGGTVIADGAAGTRDGHGKRVSQSMLAGVKLYSCRNPIWTYNKSSVRNGDVGQACRDELIDALKIEGVEATFKIVPHNGTPLPGCEVVHFMDGDAAYLGILQGREHIRSAKENHDPVPVTIMLPRKAHVYSVRDGKDLGETDTIQTGIEPAVAKLYAILPCRVESLSVSGISDVYERGAAVDYTVSSETLPASGIPQVFRVEVSSPGVGVYKEYCRTLYAPKGEAQGAFTLALSDSPGKWTILVTDVATRTTAEKTFSVLLRPSADVAPARWHEDDWRHAATVGRYVGGDSTSN